MEDGSDEESNIGIAFALTIGAGAATALGAAVVFVPWAVKYANRKTLAGSLGLSAGVMTYVSFVEIFQKSIRSFLDSGMSPKEAYRYATICFFGGVVFMVLLNTIVTKCLRGNHHRHHSHGGDITPPGNRINHTTKSMDSMQENNAQQKESENEPPNLQHIPEPFSACLCCSEDPTRDLESLQQMAEAVQHGGDSTPPRDDINHTTKSTDSTQENNANAQQMENENEPHNLQHHPEPLSACLCCSEDPTRDLESLQQMAEAVQHNEPSTHGHGSHDHFVSEQNEDEQGDGANKRNEDAKLMRMSINTAIAIGLHNFPEGLATFVAALVDPSVGAVLAIAIALHNIPEGLCVAMPIYYATGKRWNAFAWACLSGVSEPIAALLGWAVLANSFDDTIYAVLFAMVAGMMVIISTRELLPTAHRYDTEDSVVTYSFIGGMMIMAASLVLFAETK